MSLTLAISNLSQPDFDFILKNGARSRVLDGVDFQSLSLFSFGFVKKTLPDLLKKADFDAIILAAFSDRKNYRFESDLESIPSKDMLSFVLWLTDEVQAISKLEQDYLSSSPDPDLVAAGINNLNEFAEDNIIDMLAGGDILKWQEIEKMSYAKVFDKQLMIVRQREVDKKYTKIIQDKQKTRKK